MCKLLVLVLVAVVPLVSMAEELSYEKMKDMENTWIDWKKQHSKAYSLEEETHRRMIFFRTVLSNEKHNLKYPKETTYTKGLNQFSDMTVEEYRDYNRLYSTPSKTGSQSYNCSTLDSLSGGPDIVVPAFTDWRYYFNTPVYNQMRCAASYAFAAADTIAFQNMLQKKKLTDISKQQLVDCSTENDGCEGGDVDASFHYVKDVELGLETESEYPYTGFKGPCVSHMSWDFASIIGCVDLTPGDEQDLLLSVAMRGPVAVKIDASHESFKDYQRGVYYEAECSTTELNHYVMVAGYGTDYRGQDYWIIKNSWGFLWGDWGTARMARNNGNMCGIATKGSYPLCF